MKTRTALCLWFAALSIFAAPQIQAQTQKLKVSGVVVDATGNPLLGATVFESGTQNGTMTDYEGKFEVTVSKATATLDISYIGFKTLSLPANSPLLGQPVVLEEDARMLENVVIIGYGTVKKTDMTGSISAIKAEELNRGTITSTHELLQGKVSGLMVIPGGGAPGSDATLRIRGASSLNASNDPLIVLDGIPLEQNGLSAVNPNDIESFTVLKDASSAAIYGSRASNGVIIITTKKGSSNGKKFEVRYNGGYSVKQNSAIIDVMDAAEFSSHITDIYGNKVATYIGTADTDWQSLIYRLGTTQDHNVSFSGNIGKQVPYRVSLGYTHETGTIVHSWNDRGTVDITLAPKMLKEHLTVTINAKGGLSSGYSSNQASNAANYNPTMPVYNFNEDGAIDYTTTHGYFNYGTGKGTAFAPGSLVAQNPLGAIYETNYSGLTYKVIANATVNYKVHGFEDLRFNLNIGTDENFGYYKSGPKIGSFSAYSDSYAKGVGRYTDSKWNNYNRVLEAYANYNHDFNGHAVDFMAGYSWQHVYSNSESASRFNDAYESYLKDDVYGNITYNATEHYLISFFGRANYSYKGKYLFTFTLRDDASSRFSPETRWGLFPSAAFAWNIAEESFIKGSETLSSLKLRLGWGVTGQQEIGKDYPYLARYTMSTSISHLYNMGIGGLSYYLEPQAYDPNIKWESTATYNIGLDYGIFDQRITGSLDAYLRDTYDLLNEVSVAMGSNFSNTLLTNVGNIRNKGIEASVNVIPVSNTDWHMEVGLNGTWQDIKFTKLTSTDDENYFVQVGSITAGTGGYLQQHKVGYAPYTYYCYQQVYDSNGNPIQNAVVDRDGNGEITDNDRYLTGKSPNPDFFYGVNFKLSYKKWDFGFNGHGATGNWMFNDYYCSNSTSNITLGYDSINNFPKTVLRTGWKAANEIAQNYSDYWLENASFFRMDDINLGYTFQMKHDVKLRVAGSVQNVFVLTKYSGIDPEASSVDGIDYSIWPRPRIYSLRVNFSF